MLPKKILRIASRKSPLAMWQTHAVKNQLQHLYPELHIEIIGLITEGDRHLQTPLSQIGGKQLFVKELEQAILSGDADFAVHSVKDLPATLPEGLTLAGVCQRADARDVLIANHPAWQALDLLPNAATVGTSSSRRAGLLKALYPDLITRTVRGNVETRLHKLDTGFTDALLLAAAGIERLGLQDRIRAYLDPEIWTPAVGQGAIGIECRAEDAELLTLLSPLNHEATAVCIAAERSMNEALGGGCQLPIAGYATLEDNILRLRGLVIDPETATLIRHQVSGEYFQAQDLGQSLAEMLLGRGAKTIIDKLLAFKKA
ncbi:MAG: hydroxymethylbilane synthase [Gammaproteobacteria bacterium]